MNIDKKAAFEYEIKSSSLIMSFFYLVFPKIFFWLIERKYKRYLEFIEIENNMIIKGQSPN